MKTSVFRGDLTESSKSPASIAKSNKQLFGYEQVAKRIANIRLTMRTDRKYDWRKKEHGFKNRNLR